VPSEQEIEDRVVLFLLSRMSDEHHDAVIADIINNYPDGWAAIQAAQEREARRR